MVGSTGFEPAFSAPITINDLEDRFGYDPIKNTFKSDIVPAIITYSCHKELTLTWCK